MKIIAANWKLQKNPLEARLFFTSLKEKLSATGAGHSTNEKNSGKNNSQQKKLVIFPSSTCFESVAQAVAGTDWEWGSQNCYSEGKGAFTGEISAQVVKDMGGAWVLLGHSERRTLFHESNEFIAQKLALVQSLGLQALLCIGETLSERESGKTNLVLKEQLQKSLSQADQQKALVIAYEPVWAIGTGKVASVDQVKETHQFVHATLLELGFSDRLPILYGGSVKPENTQELTKIPHVDGFLIGGASLDPESYSQIYLRS